MSSVCWPRPYQPTLRLISRARHKQNGDFSLRPSAGTSKNVDTTFKHWDWNIKWAPAWWGTIYQGLKHLWRAAEIWKSFSPQSPVHCCTTLNNSISGGLGHSFFAPDVHQPRHPTWSHWGSGWRVVSTDRYKNQAAFYQSKIILWYSSRGSMRQEWEWQTCVTL